INIKPIVRCTMLVGLILLSACSTSHSTRSTSASIISLKENLPTLQDRARDWNSDAYLTDVDIPIQTKTARLWLISASFQSPSEEYESLLVTLELDGRVTVSRVEHKNPVNHEQRIDDGDLRIDSVEALDMMLDSNELRFLQTHDPQCSSLDLKRDLARQDYHPVVWIVSLWDCSVQSDENYTFLDALTGEVIPPPWEAPNNH